MNHNKKPWKPVYIPTDPKEFRYYDIGGMAELREDDDFDHQHGWVYQPE